MSNGAMQCWITCVLYSEKEAFLPVDDLKVTFMHASENVKEAFCQKI